MKETLESGEGFFPADAKASIVLKPGDRALNGPSAIVASQGTTVLGLGSVRAVRCDHLDSKLRHLSIKTITVVSFVTNDALWKSGTEHEAKEFLDETAFMRSGRPSAHIQRKSLGINENHDFDALTSLGAADPVTAPFGFGKGSIHKAFVETKRALFFDQLPHRTHDLFEDTGFNPVQKPAMDTAFGAIVSRQILPFGSAIENPENARQRLSFWYRWTTSLGTGLKIRNEITENIQFIFTKFNHPNNLAPSMPNLGFWDSFYHGTSPNAVKSQIWIAVCVYLMVAIIHKQIALPGTLHRTLQLLSVHPFDKVTLHQPLTEDDSQVLDPVDSNQLML